jgi:hypothetical protein
MGSTDSFFIENLHLAWCNARKGKHGSIRIPPPEGYCWILLRLKEPSGGFLLMADS